MQELQLFKVQKIPIHFCCGSHVGGQNNAHQPIFPYDMIENCINSLAHNSIFVGPNDLKFGTETSYIVLKAIPKLEVNFAGPFVSSHVPGDDQNSQFYF